MKDPSVFIILCFQISCRKFPKYKGKVGKKESSDRNEAFLVGAVLGVVGCLTAFLVSLPTRCL